MPLHLPIQLAPLTGGTTHRRAHRDRPGRRRGAFPAGRLRRQQHQPRRRRFLQRQCEREFQRHTRRRWFL